MQKHHDSVMNNMLPFRFFDLPRELRDEIYGLALVDIDLELGPSLPSGGQAREYFLRCRHCGEQAVYGRMRTNRKTQRCPRIQRQEVFQI